MSSETPTKTTKDIPKDLVIPGKLAFSDEIEDPYKFLYAYIAYRCNDRGYIWHETETLATNIGKSYRAVERGLKALSDAKWIFIDNWVKAGDLYDQDHRRVIWIYSDYLVALDKGGYGKTRPLPFRTWKQRFINAILDNKKIPLVLYFFPLMEEMGSKQVYFEIKQKRFFKFIKKDGEYSTEKLSQEISVQIWRELYEFYLSCHNAAAPDPEKFQEIKNFSQFQKHIREVYIDKKIIQMGDKELSVNALGMLTKEKDGEILQLTDDEAVKTWQWLYVNQQEINTEI